ncbi:MAG: PEGA domain-containing protein, partial [Vicinamibacterales bacterium]
AGSSSSSGSGSARPGGGGGGFVDFAPQRPERRAVPRDRSTASSGNAGSSDGRRVAPGGAVSRGDASDDRRRAVPAYARPRDGRPVVGTAVERRTAPPVIGGIGAGSYYYYDPYYRFSSYYGRVPYGYYAGYGFGVGYFYDPWMWGFYSPYGYGSYDPYYGGGGGGGYSQYSRSRYRDVGSLRLKVKPDFGQVYVDGYYVGEVDSFDGVFQKLPIDAGAHRVEIRAPGYETVQFEVMVIAGETVTYKGEMKRIQ